MALEAFVNGKKKKTAQKVGETLRLELNLVLSSEEQSNEFFYPTLVEERTNKVTFWARLRCIFCPTECIVHGAICGCLRFGVGCLQ
jgi:hypothetical protein